MSLPGSSIGGVGAGAGAVSLGDVGGTQPTETDRQLDHIMESVHPAYNVDGVPAGIVSTLKTCCVPGGAMVVINGEETSTSTFGLKKTDEVDPVSDTTKFNVGSLSKVVTILVIKEVIEKKPDLFRDDELEILKSLLTHRAGIDDKKTQFHRPGDINTPLCSYGPGTEKPSLETVVFGINPEKTRKDWDYSNAGYSLVEHMLEEKLGIAFSEIAQTYLFGTLGLKNTTFKQTDVSEKASSHGVEGQYTREETNEFASVAPGGLWTTASDFAQLIKKMVQLEEGSEWQTVIKQEMNLEEGVTVIEHEGRNPGSYAVFRFDLESKTGVFICTNSGEGKLVAGNLLRTTGKIPALKKVGFPTPDASPSYTRSTTVSDLQRFTGKFRRNFPTNSYFELYLKEGSCLFCRSVVDGEERQGFEVVPVQSDDGKQHFVTNNPPYPVFPFEMTFSLDDLSNPIINHIPMRARPYPAPKIP